MMILFFCFIFQGNLQLSLNNQAVATGENLHLSDVLQPESYAALKAQGVKNLKVMRAPNGSMRHSLRRAVVHQAIKKAAPGLQLGWKGPLQTTVSRKNHLFSKKDIAAQVRSWMESHQTLEGTLHLDEVRVPNIRLAQQGKITYQIRPGNNMRAVGRNTMYLDIQVDGVPLRSVILQVKTSLETLVAVAAHDIQRGFSLNENSVVWESRRLTRLNAPLISQDAFQDVRAKRMLKAGTLLTTRDLEKTPLVTRNQQVSVVVSRGAMEIRMQALCLDNGAKGDLVRLRNTSSGKIFNATVSAPGETRLGGSRQRSGYGGSNP